jgi:hypothetical protein
MPQSETQVYPPQHLLLQIPYPGIERQLSFISIVVNYYGLLFQICAATTLLVNL